MEAENFDWIGNGGQRDLLIPTQKKLNITTDRGAERWIRRNPVYLERLNHLIVGKRRVHHTMCVVLMPYSN
jgi:hypothetical protein